MDCGSGRGSNKANPPLAHLEEERSRIVSQSSASGLPGRSGELKITQPQLKLQETLIDTLLDSQDQIGQDTLKPISGDFLSDSRIESTISPQQY